MSNKLSKCPICGRSFRPSTKEELREDTELLGEEFVDLGDLGRPTCKCDPEEQIRALLAKVRAGNGT